MLNILVQKLHFPQQNIGRKIRKNIFLFLIFIPLEAGDPPASTEPILVKIFYRLLIFRGMFCWGKCPFQNQRYFGIVTLECSHKIFMCSSTHVHVADVHVLNIRNLVLSLWSNILDLKSMHTSYNFCCPAKLFRRLARTLEF